MNLLFIEAGTKYKKSKLNNYYTDGNFDRKIWDRYKSYCDNLEIIGRQENKIYEDEYAKRRFNRIKDISNLILLDDIYTSKINFLNPFKRKKISSILKEEINKNDFVIIRSITKFYTFKAAEICRKLKKNYLIEVTGSAFDSLWYRGDIYGKIIAIPTELKKKSEIKKAKNVIYVTNYFLQKEYPNHHNNIGCSDVEIETNENLIKRKEKRFKNINLEEDDIFIGTIGPVNSKLKGQQDVIKALYLLKRKYGISNIKYSLVGRGNSDYLKKIISKYNLQDNVFIEGEKTHEGVFEWLKDVDIYIQPSYTEGLCRSIIEAMNAGCPIIASDAGGNFELTNKAYIFHKGNVNEIVKKLLQMISNRNNLINESDRSYNLANSFANKVLDKRRKDFYMKCFNVLKGGKE